MGKKRFVIESDFIYEGLRCVVIFGRQGHRCGYVGIPKEHSLYNTEYMDSDIVMDIDIHGGITFSGGNEDYPVETEDKLWWFGFDLGHYGDGKDLELALKYELLDESTYSRMSEIENMFPVEERVRTLEYCIDECKSLAEQLSEVK